jgi:hypothetical protein
MDFGAVEWKKASGSFLKKRTKKLLLFTTRSCA